MGSKSSCLPNPISLAIVFCLFTLWAECFPVTNKVSNAMSFLENYGYLPKSDEKHGSNLLSSDELRRAIVLMQIYANISRTGIIDEQTLEKINSPRCGLPDVHSDQKTIIYNRSKRFAIYGPKWTKSPITWSLVQPSRQVPTDTQRQIFYRALRVWSQASRRLNFVEIGDPDADIKIGFYVKNHGCLKRDFDGPGTKLAHAFGPPNGDVHFDDDEDWKDGLRLYWAALHEFGHSLGFKHNSDKSSIMFSYYQEHCQNFQLPEVDAAGIRYLYSDINTEREDNLNHNNNDQGEYNEPASASNKSTCISNIDAIASIRDNIFVFKDDVMNFSMKFVPSDSFLIICLIIVKYIFNCF